MTFTLMQQCLNIYLNLDSKTDVASMPKSQNPSTQIKPHLAFPFEVYAETSTSEAVTAVLPYGIAPCQINISLST